MAVRWKKYHKECKGKRADGDRCGKVITKGVECEGRRGKHCPEGVSGTCGRWMVEFFDDNKKWVSLSFKDVRSKKDTERRLSMFIADRERGKLSLPNKKAIPTLTAYSKTYSISLFLNIAFKPFRKHYLVHLHLFYKACTSFSSFFILA